MTNVHYKCNVNLGVKIGGEITFVIITSVRSFEVFYPLTLVNI